MCETINRNEGADLLNSRLLDKRKLFIFGSIDSKTARQVISSLIFLGEEDAEKKITVYVDAEGGDQAEALGIYDVMRHLPCPVETVCVGKAHGMAALVLAGGTKGLRKAYANSEIMLMQIGHERAFGQASDIELATEHLLQSKKRINGIFASLCGKTEEEITAVSERKFWMYAENAKEFGLIDAIIE
jgi:ATP-dependent Clp protease protease subunit